MKTPIINSFDELKEELKEFPEFLPMAKKMGIGDMAQAYKIHSEHFGETIKDRISIILSEFIIHLPFAYYPEYIIITGKILGFPKYKIMIEHTNPANVRALLHGYYNEAREQYHDLPK